MCCMRITLALLMEVPLRRMVFEAKMRWCSERDYQDLMQEPGACALRGPKPARLSPPRQPEHLRLRMSSKTPVLGGLTLEKFLVKPITQVKEFS